MPTQRDINTSAIRTVVKLFDRLDLQPADASSEEEAGHIAARLFNRYFNFLFKMSKGLDGMVGTVSYVSSIRINPPLTDA